MRILAKTIEAKAQESMTKNQHEQRSFQAIHVPEGFEKIVTISFKGVASKAAMAIAKVVGYEVRFEGVPHSHESFVRINLKDRPINDALKELGAQTGDLIRIEIHEPAKLLVFKYKQL